VIIKNISGLSLSIQKVSLDGTYDVVQVGKRRLEPGSRIIITDSYAVESLRRGDEGRIKLEDQYLAGIKIKIKGAESEEERSWEVSKVVMRATFGPDILKEEKAEGKFRIGSGPVELKSLEGFGCTESDWKREGEDFKSKVVLVRRGECKFTDKVYFGVQAGAIGLIVISDDEELLIANADQIPSRIKTIPVRWYKELYPKEESQEGMQEKEIEIEKQLSLLKVEDQVSNSIPLVVISQSDGNWIQSIMDWYQDDEKKGFEIEVIRCPDSYRIERERFNKKIIVNGYVLGNVDLWDQ
ncbi:hypothetical protein DFH28DRAFT_878017, partial [Melampsora americana]